LQIGATRHILFSVLDKLYMCQYIEGPEREGQKITRIDMKIKGPPCGERMKSGGAECKVSNGIGS
jgi:hypothetical protein